MEFDLVIKNGIVVTENGIREVNIGIKNEIISALFISDDYTSVKTIDAGKKIVLPGVVDSHTHFRLQDMGKIITTDTFETGSRAAAFGGVTTIIDFADQTRGESPIPAFEERKKIFDKEACIDYGLHISVTDPNFKVDFQSLIREKGVVSFKIFTTYSWRKLYLTDAQIFDFLGFLADEGAIAVFHCENDSMVVSGRQKYIDENRKDPIYHAMSRPNIVESEAIQRMINFIDETSVRGHIFHISTKEGGLIVENAIQSMDNLTSETCPHYLLLNDEAYKIRDGYTNLMSPPLRKVEDQYILQELVLNGAIDCIITDHCEFSRESKGNGKLAFHEVPNGIPGIETSLPLMHELFVNQLQMEYPQFSHIISTNPAKIFGLYPKKGCIAVGSDADLVVFNPTKEVTISPEKLHYNIDWNPYTGMKVTGWPEKTILRGKVIVDGDNFLGSTGQGRFIHRSVHDC
jgi:dihydropyrimidinase